MIDEKIIAITRSPEDATEFIQLASRNNARPILLPTIELVSKDEKIVDKFLQAVQEHNPDYSVFMSSKAVKLLLDMAKILSKFKQVQLAIANTIVIAVGPKTKIALEEQGIKVNHIPKRYSSVGVGEMFTKLNAVGKKVIVPRSGASTPFLKELLVKIGLDVIETHLYDVCTFSDTSQWNEFRELFSHNKIDGIIFTSVSSVKAFFEIMRKDLDEKTLLDNLQRSHIVSIGPFTTDELNKLHVQNTVSQIHTILGSFDTIKKML